MIARIREEDIAEKINFTTNGLLLTPKRIDALIAAGLDTIRVSLQGLTAEMYQKMCGVKVNFEEFLNNLKYLYDHRKKCKVRMKIADIALKDVPHGNEKFEELFGDKADSLFVEHILPIYADVDYTKLDRQIQDNSMNGRGNVPQHEVHKVCHRPFYRLRVTANGEVMANCCDQPHDIRYGNINEQGLVELWKWGRKNCFPKNAAPGESISASCVQKLHFGQ